MKLRAVVATVASGALAALIALFEPPARGRPVRERPYVPRRSGRHPVGNAAAVQGARELLPRVLCSALVRLRAMEVHERRDHRHQRHQRRGQQHLRRPGRGRGPLRGDHLRRRRLVRLRGGSLLHDRSPVPARLLRSDEQGVRVERGQLRGGHHGLRGRGVSGVWQHRRAVLRRQRVRRGRLLRHLGHADPLRRRRHQLLVARAHAAGLHDGRPLRILRLLRDAVLPDGNRVSERVL